MNLLQSFVRAKVVAPCLNETTHILIVAIFLLLLLVVRVGVERVLRVDPVVHVRHLEVLPGTSFAFLPLATFVVDVSIGVILKQ